MGAARFLVVRVMHAYHDGLPGFDAAQILHDGCDECEHRGRNVERAIGHMDMGTFARAWARAASWRGAGPLSGAEHPTIAAIWALQIQLERRGIPIGQLPGSASARLCVGGCGLTAAPGDIFCEGCRSGHDRAMS